MAKLYAELSSDKGGRVASKGGDKVMMIKVNYKNEKSFFVNFDIQHDKLNINVGDASIGGKNYLCQTIELKSDRAN
jgi:hypothetical protein